MTIYYFDPTRCEEPKPVDYKYPAIHKTVEDEKGDQCLPGPKGDKGDPGQAGADGRTPYLHIAYANSADGTADFSTTDSAGKTYIGLCTDFVEEYPTDPALYKWILIKGEKGDKGDDGVAGKDGVGISSTAITYAATPSGTIAPTSGWSTSVPTVSPGMFLWTKTVWTYTDNTSKTGYSVAKMGEAGPKGEDGAVNITCGFTQGFSDSFTAVGAGVGAITALSDGWARFQYTNTTSATQRIEFYLPKVDGLTENQVYTFLQEVQNNKSSTSMYFYFVQANPSAFWGNVPDSTLQVSGNVKRTVRVPKTDTITLAQASRLVTVNINVPAGATLDVETRISCYVGDYSGAYIPFQGGKTGPKGDKGDPGPQGPAGPQGPKGG